MLLNFSVMTQRQLITALICGEMRTNGYIQRYITSDGYEDELGDYHEGETHLDDEKIECLANVNGQPQERLFEDGVTRKYTFTAFLPPRVRCFEVGERVRLTRYGKVFELEVKGFVPYNLQYKLWLG